MAINQQQDQQKIVTNAFEIHLLCCEGCRYEWKDIDSVRIRSDGAFIDRIVVMIGCNGMKEEWIN